MAVQGITRLRKHLMARQQVVGTVVPATMAYPYQGVPDTDLGWTDQEVDAGSIDVTAPPFRGAQALTAPLTQNALGYNHLPKIFSGFFGGNQDPTGAGPDFSWWFDPASATIDEVDYYTYQFGDDVLTDWFQFGDGIIESFEITAADGTTPLTSSENWRFGSVRSTGSTDSPASGTVPTAGINVATGYAMLYLKDCEIFIASTVAGLGAGQVSRALHGFTLRGTKEIDEKRWADGTQSFDYEEIAVASRALEIELVFSKTADTVGTGSESDAWMSDEAVNRYIRLTFTSTVEADTGTFYSWTADMPVRYYTRTEGEIGGNSTVVLTGHLFYDPEDLDGIFETTIVNTLSGAQLGSVGS